jgi:hypothetical protein
MIYSSYELAYAAGTADNRLFINEVSRYDLPITPKNSTCWSWTASLTLCHEYLILTYLHFTAATLISRRQ